MMMILRCDSFFIRRREVDCDEATATRVQITSYGMFAGAADVGHPAAATSTTRQPSSVTPRCN